jgi:hypothetical protein
VQKIGGSALKSAEVAIESPRSLTIRIQVRSESEGKDVAAKILSLPELYAYQVDLQMQVSP